MRTKRQHRLLHSSQPQEQIVEHSVGTPTPPTTGGYLPTLDGWRAIAILGVMVVHGTAGLLGMDGAFSNDRLYALSRYGAMGVDVFFGMSGFLICSRSIARTYQSERVLHPPLLQNPPSLLRPACVTGSAQRRGRLRDL